MYEEESIYDEELAKEFYYEGKFEEYEDPADYYDKDKFLSGAIIA